MSCANQHRGFYRPHLSYACIKLSLCSSYLDLIVSMRYTTNMVHMISGILWQSTSQFIQTLFIMYLYHIVALFFGSRFVLYGTLLIWCTQQVGSCTNQHLNFCILCLSCPCIKLLLCSPQLGLFLRGTLLIWCIWHRINFSSTSAYNVIRTLLIERISIQNKVANWSEDQIHWSNTKCVHVGLQGSLTTKKEVPSQPSTYHIISVVKRVKDNIDLTYKDDAVKDNIELAYKDDAIFFFGGVKQIIHPIFSERIHLQKVRQKYILKR